MVRISIPLNFEIKDKRQPSKKKSRSKADRGQRGEYTTGDSNLVSKYGGVQEPKKHYKRRRQPRRRIPETGKAPFETEAAFIPGFGGTQYVPPRGFQQEKVARRGAVRRNVVGPAFPGYTARLEDKFRKLETSIEALAEGRFKAAGKGLGQAGRFASNPQAEVSNTVLTMLGGAGPYGAAAVAAITGIVIAAETIPRLIQALGVKGGLNNFDWHRAIAEEIYGLLTLEDQKARILGADSFIVAQGTGYRPIDGTDVYNSLFMRDEDRLARIGQDAKAKGVG